MQPRGNRALWGAGRGGISGGGDACRRGAACRAACCPALTAAHLREEAAAAETVQMHSMLDSTARYRKRDCSLFGGNNADAAAGHRCTPGPCRAVLHTPLAPDKLHCTVALSIPNVGLVDNALNCGAKSCLSPCACAAIQVEGRQLPWYCWDVLEGGRFCPAFHTQLTVCVPRIRG